MGVNDDIAKTQKRLRELRKRQAKEKGELSYGFFRDNGIKTLLEDKELMKQFTAEIEPVLAKYGKTKNVKSREKADDENE